MTLALAPTPETQGVYWVWVSEDLIKPYPHAPLSTLCFLHQKITRVIPLLASFSFFASVH